MKETFYLKPASTALLTVIILSRSDRRIPDWNLSKIQNTREFGGAVARQCGAGGVVVIVRGSGES